MANAFKQNNFVSKSKASEMPLCVITCYSLGYSLWYTDSGDIRTYKLPLPKSASLVQMFLRHPIWEQRVVKIPTSLATSI